MHRLLKLLARVAAALDDVPEWSVKVHPFRVLASAEGEGRPTPEGLHRDGLGADPGSHPLEVGGWPLRW